MGYLEEPEPKNLPDTPIGKVIDELIPRHPAVLGAMTILCVTNRHDECRREACPCECHQGGSRDRLPDDPAPVEGLGAASIETG